MRFSILKVNKKPNMRLQRAAFCIGRKRVTATAEPYRRKGIAEASTNYALREAHASGAKLAILQAGSPGAASLYRKLGFREEISIATYVG
jgi:GNAT superfamily N-acetyltransferase